VRAGSVCAKQRVWLDLQQGPVALLLIETGTMRRVQALIRACT
jgi:hypothetical protein